jgi:hypothetical protein
LKYRIASEYSAQRMTHPPSPALPRVLKWLHGKGTLGARIRAADLGCGRLRHFDALSHVSKELFLVDTDEQLARQHRDGALTYTIPSFAAQHTNHRSRALAMAFSEFQTSRLKLDVVFCIAVFDVVPRETRRAICQAAFRNGLLPEK